MRRSPVPGIDLGVYAAALPLLVRNPAIIVVPLLMLIVGVLIGQLFPGGGLGGFATLFATLLSLFGLGAACIMADDAWRHARASFESAWTDARRRAGDIFMAALGVTLLITVAQFVGSLLGPLSLLLVAAVAIFLIWTVPAAAIGGIPGGAAIQVSIDRVRATPLPAAIAAIVSVLLIFFARLAAINVAAVLVPYTGDELIVGALIGALLQAIAIGYIALVLSKTYADSAFRAPRW
ncbi:MAG: hypothetical protein ABI186_05305 [Candidatus Elarobacter sp.]